MKLRKSELCHLLSLVWLFDLQYKQTENYLNLRAKIYTKAVRHASMICHVGRIAYPYTNERGNVLEFQNVRYELELGDLKYEGQNDG